MNTQDYIASKLNTLIDYAHKTGYYQAVLEKADLNNAERQNYNRLNREAIENRINTRVEIETLIASLEKA